MSEHTTIEWCDATFNPWWGCQKVSPACDHCYAERDSKRFAPGRVLWGVGSERRTFGDKHWKAPTDWAKRAFVECPACGWRGMHTALRHEAGNHRCPSCGNDEWRPARMRVFCASMGDWLDLDAPLDEFVRLLDTIRKTPELDWLLLSKRIGNWQKRLVEAQHKAYLLVKYDLTPWIGEWVQGRPPANVWLGATVVTQEEADRDIPKLLATPARVRFLSIEPMLGAIDLAEIDDGAAHREIPREFWTCMDSDESPPSMGMNALTGERWQRFGEWTQRGSGVDWIIAGGESGPHARPAHPDWFRSLRDQCAAAGVPFFMKQMGGVRDKRGALDDLPEDLRVREFPL